MTRWRKRGVRIPVAVHATPRSTILAFLESAARFRREGNLTLARGMIRALRDRIRHPHPLAPMTPTPGQCFPIGKES